jgi:hypothetical protein
MMILVEDMSNAEQDISELVDFLRLEELFASSHEKEVLKAWFEKRQQLDAPLGFVPKATTSLARKVSLQQWEKQLAIRNFDKKWLELGIRLHAQAGQLFEPSRLLIGLAKKYLETNPRFVLYIILYLTSTREGTNVDRAWETFVDLLAHKQFSLSFHGFELITRAFLDAGQLTYATGVTGSALKYVTEPEHQSRVLEDIVPRIFASCTSQVDVHQYAAMMMDFIPRSSFKATQLFSAAWAERAKEYKDSEQIAYIIEILYERGLGVGASQLGVLLELWLQGSPQQAQKAESLAQAMLRQSINPSQQNNPISVLEQSLPRQTPGFLRRNVPPATPQTYRDLLVFYAQRNDSESVGKLIQLLPGNSALVWKPSTARAVLSVYLTLGYVEDAWRFFNHIDNESLVVMDLATYKIIWKGLHQYLSTEKRVHRDESFTARNLLKHMLAHLSMQEFISEDEEIPKTMFQRIIKCFCLSNDTIGLYLALEVLESAFRAKPSIDTIKDIVKHIAIQHSAIEHHEQAPRKPWIEHLSASMRMLESAFLNDRLHRNSSTRSLDGLYHLDTDTSGDEILSLLFRYIWKAAVLRYPHPNALNQQFNVAKREMGILDFTKYKQVLKKGTAVDGGREDETQKEGEHWQEAQRSRPISAMG